MFYDLQVLELPEQLLHLLLLDLHYLLETVDLALLFEHLALGAVQLLLVTVLDIVLELLESLLKVLLLVHDLVFLDLQLLLQEQPLSVELPLYLHGFLFFNEALGDGPCGFLLDVVLLVEYRYLLLL